MMRSHSDVEHSVESYLDSQSTTLEVCRSRYDEIFLSSIGKSLGQS